MTTTYLLLKMIHVVSAALLFGTGLGTAFFMWFTHRSGDVAAIARVSRLTVLADGLFTAPAVVVQPLSGLALVHLAGWDLRAGWILGTVVLYVIAGICWLPVVWLQLRVRDLAAAATAEDKPLPPAYHVAMRRWFLLGWPAFAAVLVAYWLMIAKPTF